MILQRGISTSDLVLVRRPKPCKAVLQVGDFVKLNGIRGWNFVRVVNIKGDEITVKTKNWQGEPEVVSIPRICLRKSRISGFRKWLADRIDN